MTNNELKELKIKIVKKIKIRTSIYISLAIIINIIFVLVLAVYAEDNDINPVLLGILMFFELISLILFVVPFIYNAKDRTYFNQIKTSEYQKRIAYDAGFTISLIDIKDKTEKYNIKQEIKKINIDRGSATAENAIKVSSSFDFKKYDISIVQSNGKSSTKVFDGYVFVLPTPNFSDIYLSINENKKHSYDYKKASAEEPYLFFKKDKYKTFVDVEKSKVALIKNADLKFREFLRNSSLSPKKFGITTDSQVTYIYFSKDRSEKFNKVLDFEKDYNSFLLQLNNIDLLCESLSLII